MIDLLAIGLRFIGWVVATCLGSIGVVAALACLRRPDLFWPDTVLLLGAASAITITIGNVGRQ